MRFSGTPSPALNGTTSSLIAPRSGPYVSHSEPANSVPKRARASTRRGGSTRNVVSCLAKSRLRMWRMAVASTSASGSSSGATVPASTRV